MTDEPLFIGQRPMSGLTMENELRSRKVRILVVDDDLLAGEMIAAILQEDGHEILLARDAMDAMTQLERHEDIAVIVSDMHMPLIDGIELYRTLQEQGIHLPFILLTGSAPEFIDAEKIGLTACLMKDADMDVTLRDAISSMISH